MNIFKAWATFDACPGHVEVPTDKPAKCSSKFGYSYDYGDNPWKITRRRGELLGYQDKVDLRKSIQDLVSQMKIQEDAVKVEKTTTEEIFFSSMEPLDVASLISTVPIIECLYCRKPGASRWRQYDAANFVFAEHPMFPYDQGVCPGSGLSKTEIKLRCSHCTSSFIFEPEGGVNLQSHPLPYHGINDTATDLCPGSGRVVGTH